MVHEDFNEAVILQRLQQELGEFSSSVLIRWIAILDLMTPDQERYLAVVTSPGMEQWEFDGMFRNAPYPWDEEDEKDEDEG